MTQTFVNEFHKINEAQDEMMEMELTKSQKEFADDVYNAICRFMSREVQVD